VSTFFAVTGQVDTSVVLAGETLHTEARAKGMNAI
jgi:hypothetical protein